MYRIGLYDALDKWEILCRYWKDRDSAADIGTDMANRPLVPKWHRIATTSGLNFGNYYLASRIRGPRPAIPGVSAGAAAARGEPWLEEEIARLAAALGPAELRARYRGLALTVTGSGFEAPYSNGMSPPLVSRLKQIFKQGALEGLQWTQDDGEVPTLPILRSWSSRFPVAALRQKSNVLCMFCCRFYGRADVIHIHDAGPDTVTLVDNDAARMTDMKLIYPPHWNYVIGDYKEFLAEAVRSDWKYDVIIADLWRSMAREVAWDFLPTIMSICSDTFIVNYFDDMFEELQVPPTDLVGLSQAVSERAGIKIAFTQIEPRQSPVYWALMRQSSAAAA